MKKLVVASILAGALAVSVYGQGTVVFNNNSATVVTYSDEAKAILGTADIGPKGASFFVELYYAPDGATPGVEAMQGGRMGPAATFSTLSAGRFTGGNRTTPSTTPGGQPAYFQVRVWEAAYGATYEAAAGTVLNQRNAIAGSSPIFRISTGDPSTGGAATPITSTGGLSAGFGITPVPEPSVFALGLLGLGGLFLLRRRS